MSYEEVLSVVMETNNKLNEVVNLLSELKPYLKPSKQWFTTDEVARMATEEGFSKTANTVRYWTRNNQIDVKQAEKGEQILISEETVQQLRENGWKPLRKPDYSTLPPSKQVLRVVP